MEIKLREEIIGQSRIDDHLLPWRSKGAEAEAEADLQVAIRGLTTHNVL